MNGGRATRGVALPNRCMAWRARDGLHGCQGNRAPASMTSEVLPEGSNTMNVLLLIDFQVGFKDPVWGERNNPHAEERAKDLLTAWRMAGAQIIHIRHVSASPDSPLSGPGTEFKPQVCPMPGEIVMEKSVNSAFIGTDLTARLQAIGASDLTICGLTTPHCVSTTTRMAANLGHRVRLVEDACAAFTSNADISFDGGPHPTATDIHRSALAHLHGEFAHVCRAHEAIEAL